MFPHPIIQIAAAILHRLAGADHDGLSGLAADQVKPWAATLNSAISAIIVPCAWGGIETYKFGRPGLDVDPWAAAPCVIVGRDLAGGEAISDLMNPLEQQAYVSPSIRPVVIGQCPRCRSRSLMRCRSLSNPTLLFQGWGPGVVLAAPICRSPVRTIHNTQRPPLGG